MKEASGVYKTNKKNGALYYRASITYRNKHISLGSYDQEPDAEAAYREAQAIVRDNLYSIDDNPWHNHKSATLQYDKAVVLMNFRDNGIYFKTPIYMKAKYIEYYLSADKIIKFDKEDLFFYGNHKIMQRGGYLFVCDYGSQYGILNRFGIRGFAVKDRDYVFVNGDDCDFRYENIKVINNYMGVTRETQGVMDIYKVVIHVQGNYIVGRYEDVIDAAIAYNKAADILNMQGIKKQYIRNYILDISNEEYADRYMKIKVSKRIKHLKE